MDYREKYAYRTAKDIYVKRKKLNRTIEYKKPKMFNFHNVKNENNENNPNWPQILDYWFAIVITGCFGSGRPNALLNFISNQPDFNKMYFYAKNPY